MRAARSTMRERRRGAPGSDRSSAPPAAPRQCSRQQRGRACESPPARRRCRLRARSASTPRSCRSSRLLVRRTVGRREAGALEHHQRWSRTNLGVGAAHDTGDRLRAVGVGDDQHVWRSSARATPSSVCSVSPASRGECEARRSSQLRVVEGVRRLAHFEHHVVGDVDDRADRADPGGLQPIAHPRRRAAAPPAPRRVARSSAGQPVRILDEHVERPACGRPEPATRGRRHAGCSRRAAPVARDREPVRRRRFAREAHHAEAVRPVAR